MHQRPFARVTAVSFGARSPTAQRQVRERAEGKRNCDRHLGIPRLTAWCLPARGRPVFDRRAGRARDRNHASSSHDISSQGIYAAMRPSAIHK